MDRVRQQVGCDALGLDAGAGVRIALIDSGVDESHPDLQNSIDRAASTDFAGFQSRDVSGHGTQMASVIAGSGAASEGRYRGIAPGASVISLKVSSTTGHTDTVAKAISHAIGLGVDIISYSGGLSPGRTTGGPPPWCWPARLDVASEAMALAADSGILCVAAAGNWGPYPASVGRPASLTGVLAVGAVDRHDRVSIFSGRGPVLVSSDVRTVRPRRCDPDLDDIPERRRQPDLVAPGGADEPWLGHPDGVICARSSDSECTPGPDRDPQGVYTQATGTSHATAVVSGLAAVALARGRQLGLDWGESVGRSLFCLLTKSCRPLADAGVMDQGHGLLYWPVINAGLEDCVAKAEWRDLLLTPSKLELLR